MSSHVLRLGRLILSDGGERLIDCHLAGGLDDPCDCEVGSKTGRSMRECCAAPVLAALG